MLFLSRKDYFLNTIQMHARTHAVIIDIYMNYVYNYAVMNKFMTVSLHTRTEKWGRTKGHGLQICFHSCRIHIPPHVDVHPRPSLLHENGWWPSTWIGLCPHFLICKQSVYLALDCCVQYDLYTYSVFFWCRASETRHKGSQTPYCLYASPRLWGTPLESRSVLAATPKEIGV